MRGAEPRNTQHAAALTLVSIIVITKWNEPPADHVLIEIDSGRLTIQSQLSKKGGILWRNHMMRERLSMALDGSAYIETRTILSALIGWIML